jgi:hypothetical protein
MHDYCNVAHSLLHLDPGQTGFMRRLRDFRQNNAWLRNNLTEADHFSYVEPIDGRTLFVAHRTGPDGREVFALCHMEGGETAEIEPLDLLPEGVSRDDWYLLLRTPGIGADYAGGTIRLKDSMGLVFTRGG